MGVRGAGGTDAVNAGVQNATRGGSVVVLDVLRIHPNLGEPLLNLLVRLMQHRHEARCSAHRPAVVVGDCG